MIKESVELTDVIYVIHQAFMRYRQDPQPSSALNETIDTLSEEVAGGVKIFGAYEKDLLIGIVKCTVNQQYIYFSRLSVLPEKQGQGIAKALIQHVESYALQQKVSISKCKVRKSEKNNMALYNKLGYKIIEEESIHNSNGDIIPVVLMEKFLI